MKAKLFTAAVAGVFFFAACKNAPSEQTMKDMESFEQSWTKMSKDAEVLKADLQSSLDNCAKACEKNAAVSTEGMKANVKGELENCMKFCANDKTTFDDLKKAWEAEGATWMQADSSFKALKEKIAKNTITDEEAVKTLNELKTKLEDGNKGIEDWTGKISEAKNTCMKDMATVEACCKKMEEESSKDPKNCHMNANR